LLVARHPTVGDRPDVHEPGVHQAVRAPAAVATQRYDPALVQGKDLVWYRCKSLDVGQDSVEHIALTISVSVPFTSKAIAWTSVCFLVSTQPACSSSLASDTSRAL